MKTNCVPLQPHLHHSRPISKYRPDTLAKLDGYPSMADSADSNTKNPNGDGTYTETVHQQAAYVVRNTIRAN
jgi:hypothetical protein